MKTYTQHTHDIVQRLTVAGHFANGVQMGKDDCLNLAKALTHLAEQADRGIAIAQATQTLEESKRFMRRQGWEAVKAVLICAGVMLLFTLIGWATS